MDIRGRLSHQQLTYSLFALMKYRQQEGLISLQIVRLKELMHKENSKHYLESAVL